jgi:Ohr subfamily peroxiredoxin
MPEYTATATTTGGRNGHVDTSDGLLHFDLSVPKDIGGPGQPGATNPEQLFASGYSACFGGAIDYVAKLEKVQVHEVKVTADVTLHADPAKGFYLSAVLKVSLPGVDRATAERLAKRAHEEVCPYSKATRGNVKVDVVVV